MTRRMMSGLAGCLLLAAACGPREPAPVEAPTFFIATLQRGVITGAYNPVGFTSAEVEDAIAPICDKAALVSYDDTQAETGLTGFSGECGIGAPIGDGRAEVRKFESGRIEVTFRGANFLGRQARQWTI